MELNEILAAKARKAFKHYGNETADELIFTPRGVPFKTAKAAGEYCKAKGLDADDLIAIKRSEVFASDGATAKGANQKRSFRQEVIKVLSEVVATSENTISPGEPGKPTSETGEPEGQPAGTTPAVADATAPSEGQKVAPAGDAGKPAEGGKPATQKGNTSKPKTGPAEGGKKGGSK